METIKLNICSDEQPVDSCDSCDLSFSSSSAVDFSKSTEDNFATESSEFVGKFASQRSSLDYTYHQHYVPERQLFHDKIINKFSNTIIHDAVTGKTCNIPTDNWIVFMAGAMGAGKSRSLRFLSQHGFFPLESFVRVDADLFRELLPEFAEYNIRDPTSAGKMTQKEVNYISEVVTVQALEKGQNVLVDGSLRDAVWHSQYFNSLRHKFPSLKIAILEVTAKESTVLERARGRAAITGRVVPDQVLRKTIAQIPASMALLAPQADVVVVFENEENENLKIIHQSVRSDGVPCTSASSRLRSTASTEKMDENAELEGSIQYSFEYFKEIWRMRCPL
jgi:hypothetical protein